MSSIHRGESFESSEQSSAIQTATGGEQSSVQRQQRTQQLGGPDDDRRVTMSETSQIESEAVHDGGAQSATSRSAQHLEKLADGVKRLDGGGVERSQEAYSKLNERQEEQSRRETAGGGEETRQSSCVSKQESRQTTSVADLGGGRSGVSSSNVTKRSQVSEVSEVSETSSSSRSGNADARRLTAGQRSASLQSDGPAAFSTASGHGGSRGPTSSASSTAQTRVDESSTTTQRQRGSGTSASGAKREGNSDRGGILRELENLLADEDKFEHARRILQREQSTASERTNHRSEQIRREVDNLVADFFDRKRGQRRLGNSSRDTFFDNATRRAEELVRDFERDDDDPWRGEEERWRQQQQLRRRESGDFLQSAVSRAEGLVREMRERKERRRREETDLFSRYGDEIDAFFDSARRRPATDSLRRSGDAIDEFFSSSRRREADSTRRSGGSSAFRSASSLADDIVRDFLGKEIPVDRGRGVGGDAWTRYRDRNDSTHVDIDEAVSQASTSTARGERAARNTSDVDIEELSCSTATGGSRMEREARARAAAKDGESTRIVDDIVRQFIADDFADDDTLREERPKAARRQASNSSTVDEQCSIRSDSRMSEADEELLQQRQAQMQADEQAEEKRITQEMERRQRHQEELASEERRWEEERAARRKRTEEALRSSEEQLQTTQSPETREEQVVSSRIETQQTQKTSSQSAKSQESEELRSTQDETVDERSSSHQQHRASQDIEKSNITSEHQSRTVTAATEETHSATQSDTSGIQGEAATSSDTNNEASGEGGVDTAAAASALQRAEELLFGFVPDWEREEERWSRVRTERLAETTGDKKVEDLMSDYRPLRHVKEGDKRAEQRHQRKTEEYEQLLSGDVWRGFKDEPAARGGRARAGGAADSVLSDLRSARSQQASSASQARSQFHARKAESLNERDPVSADKSAASRRSKLEEFKSFKSELWHEK